MFRGVLLIGGAHPPAKIASRISERADIVVAADSGYDMALQWGIACDYLIGDFDSLESTVEMEKFPQDRIIRAPKAKDQTDTEMGIDLLLRRGVEEITLIGGGGGRLDHLIALVSLFDREKRPHRWYTDSHEVLSVESTVEIKGRKGETVSFFPAGNQICRMKSTGLRWSLDPLTWRHGDAGVSNEIVADIATVSPRAGRLICVLPLEEVEQ